MELTYHSILIFHTDSNGKLAFIDNLIGLCEYNYSPDGKKSGVIWDGNKI